MSVTAEPELTTRQRQILALYAMGRTRKQIGAAIFLGEWSIRDELALIQEKLGAENGRHSVAIAFSRGILVADSSGDGTILAVLQPPSGD